MQQSRVDVVVRVIVMEDDGDDPERVARNMVIDALSSRSREWMRRTFVSGGGVTASLSKEES